MILTMILTATMVIRTDGDFDFHNEDEYFNDNDFEEYRKTIVLSEKEKDRKNELENMFNEINKRVYNRYNQKEYLVEEIKKLDMNYSVHDLKKTDKLEPYKSTNGTFIYMNGNQEIKLNINYKNKYSFENEEEENEYKLWEKLNQKYQNIDIS